MNRGLLTTVLLLAGLGPAPPAAAALLLSEVLYDAAGSDSGAVFVELWGTPGTSLAGVTVEGVNGSNGDITPLLVLSGSVPADGFFVVADEVTAGVSSVANFDLLLNFDFQNGPDSVVLRDAGGAVLDALGYGVFGEAEVFAGEGDAATDPAAGFSLARVFANLDSDDNATDWIALDTPTPGAGSLAVPEPSAAAMLATLLLALAVRARAT